MGYQLQKIKRHPLTKVLLFTRRGSGKGWPHDARVGLPRQIQELQDVGLAGEIAAQSLGNAVERMNPARLGSDLFLGEVRSLISCLTYRSKKKKAPCNEGSGDERLPETTQT